MVDLCVCGERYREVQGRGRVQRVEGTFCVRVCVGGGAKLCPKVAQSLAHLNNFDGWHELRRRRRCVCNQIFDWANIVIFYLLIIFVGGRKLVAKHFAFETHEDLVCCFCPNGACWVASDDGIFDVQAVIMTNFINHLHWPSNAAFYSSIAIVGRGRG